MKSSSFGMEGILRKRRCWSSRQGYGGVGKKLPDRTVETGVGKSLSKLVVEEFSLLSLTEKVERLFHFDSQIEHRNEMLIVSIKTE